MSEQTTELKPLDTDVIQNQQDYPVQQSSSPIQVVKELTAAGISMEDLKQMLELQKEYEANEARKEFNLALAAFKSEDILIAKDKLVSFDTNAGTTSYSHASLGNIVKIAVPFMSKHGLSHRWDINQENARVVVTCILSHRLGHSESVKIDASPDNSGSKNAIQQVSSTVTYLERYTFLAITGLAVEDMSDDDGAGFTVPKQEAGEPQQTLLPSYPSEKFDKNCIQWGELISSGQKKAVDIIAAIESAYTLDDNQKKTINSYTK